MISCDLGKRRKIVKPTDLSKLWMRGMHTLSMDWEVLSTSSSTEPNLFQWRIPSDWSSSGSAHENPETVEASFCYRLGNNCLNWIPENKAVSTQTTQWHSGRKGRARPEANSDVAAVCQPSSEGEACRSFDGSIQCLCSRPPSCSCARNPSDSSLRKKYSLWQPLLLSVSLFHISL